MGLVQAKEKIVFVCFLIIFGVLCFSSHAWGDTPKVEDLTVVFDYAQEANVLTWTAVAPSTTTASVTYDIRRYEGNRNTLEGFTQIATAVETNTYTDSNFGSYMDYTYEVRANDSVEGYGEWSTKATSYYIHNMDREDSDGEQLGKGQKWEFEYQLQEDTYMSINIYEPFTDLNINGSNTYGWPDPDSGDIVKTIIDKTPRSAATGDGSWINTEEWDCRDTNGEVVPNGVYWIIFNAYSALDGTTRVGSWQATIPVDILRIMDLSSEGITATNPLGKINYTLTGDATVRIIICSPGTSFYLDSNNLPQPTSGTGTILRTYNFVRKAGTYSETWDGRDENGATLSNGLYVFAISAVDGYDNDAFSTAGNDYLIWSTLPIGTGDILLPQVSSVSPTNGSVLTDSFTQVSAVLIDEGDSGLDLKNSTISLTDSNSSSITGSVTDNGINTITLTVSEQSTNGTYTLTVVPRDNAGNVGASSITTFTMIDVTPPQVVSVTPANGTEITTSFTQVSAVLNDTGGSGLDLVNSTITLTGPMSNNVSGTKTNNGVNNLILTVSEQSMNGTYTIRVIPKDKADNTGATSTTTFTLNIAAGASTQISFSDSVYNYPNPVKNGQTRFTYNAASYGTVSIQVFDILGRKIWSVREDVTQGTKTYLWDCLNNSGNKIKSGVYIYKIKVNTASGTYEETKKMIIIQ